MLAITFISLKRTKMELRLGKSYINKIQLSKDERSKLYLISGYKNKKIRV